jgi:hypothetical protein
MLHLFPVYSYSKPNELYTNYIFSRILVGLAILSLCINRPTPKKPNPKQVNLTY